MQHVIGPTHIHGHTLDPVITLSSESLRCSLDVDTRFIGLYSDHDIIFLSLLNSARITVKTRKFSAIDHTAFATNLSSRLEDGEGHGDINSFLGDFDAIVIDVPNKHASFSTRFKAIRHRPGITKMLMTPGVNAGVVKENGGNRIPNLISKHTWMQKLM